MKTIFYSARFVGTHDRKDSDNMDAKNNYLHRCFLPFNRLQDGMTYAGRPVVNSPEFMPLGNSLDRDILHSFRFHCVLSRFVLKGEGNDEEEK